MRRWGLAASQVLIAVVALGLLWRFGNLGAASAELARAQGGYVAAAIALWAFIQGLCILRWHRVNCLAGLAVPLAPTSRAYLVGMFFNTFLPSGFGGDAVRAYKLARASGATASSVVSVVADRYVSLYALVAVSGGAVVLAPDLGRAVSQPLLLTALVLGALPIVLTLLLPYRPLRGWTNSLKALQPLSEAVAAEGALGSVAGIAGLSLVIQVLNAAMHYLLLLALGVHAPLSYVLFMIPLMSLIASLPISVNGLGLREGTLIYFLGRIGVPAYQAVALGMLSLAMLLLVGAVGGGVFAIEGLLSRRSVTPLAEA